MDVDAQPIYLVSVNNTPPVARKLVAMLIEDIRDQLNVVYIANTTTIEGLEPLLLSLVHPPQLLICSSQWTVEQQDQVLRTAKRMIPSIKTVAIPPGLNATKGGDAVVDFLKEAILELKLPSLKSD